MSTLDLQDAWGKLRPQLPPTYAIGKITVVTKTDIHKVAEQSELNIWLELKICKTGASVIHWPSVYFAGVDINYSSSTKAIRSLYRERAAARKEDEPYTYEIYFDPRSTRNEPEGVGHPGKFEPYDFEREPLELCLRIGGGNMVGGRFLSNTVTISTSEMARAFQNVKR